METDPRQQIENTVIAIMIAAALIVGIGGVIALVVWSMWEKFA